MIRLPEAPGVEVARKSGAVLDYSHADQGYVSIKRASDRHQRLTVTMNKSEYQYDLPGDGEFHVIPLPLGDGSYRFRLYERASGGSYSQVFSKTVDARLQDENLPFLYPNLYVNYNQDTQAVALAEQLCEGLTDDTEKFKVIANYVRANITYDYALAGSVLQGKLKSYVPDVDKVLERRKGICYDYSSLMACMLRSQGIATKLVMGVFIQEGQKAEAYHAWNLVLLDGKWGLIDVTFLVAGVKGQRIEDEVY